MISMLVWCEKCQGWYEIDDNILFMEEFTKATNDDARKQAIHKNHMDVEFEVEVK